VRLTGIDCLVLDECYLDYCGGFCYPDETFGSLNG
jgi:hypothetical protein